MVNTLIKYCITFLFIFQLFLEFLILFLMILFIILKPFILIYILFQMCSLYISGKICPLVFFFIKWFLIFMIILSSSHLAGFIYFLYLDPKEHFLMILYIYIWTIDVYIYYPLNIPHNPLNLRWYKLKPKKKDS